MQEFVFRSLPATVQAQFADVTTAKYLLGAPPWCKSLDQLCIENRDIDRTMLEGLEKIPVLKKIKKAQYLAIRNVFVHEETPERLLNNHAYRAYLLFGTPQKMERFRKNSRQASGRLATYTSLMNGVQFPPLMLWDKINFQEWGDAFTTKGFAATCQMFESMSAFIDPIRPNGKGISLMATSFHFLAGGSKIRPVQGRSKELVQLGWNLRKTQDEFKRACDYWFSSTPSAESLKKVIPPFQIPGEKFGMPGALFRKLDPDDPRILFIGDFTNCCERVTDTKNSLERVVQHSINNPNEGYYVVEGDDGRILTHSWAFRGKNAELVLDGFESHENLFNRTNFENLLLALRMDLLVNDDDRLFNYEITGLYLGHCKTHLAPDETCYTELAINLIPEHLEGIGMTKNKFVNMTGRVAYDYPEPHL